MITKYHEAMQVDTIWIAAGITLLKLKHATFAGLLEHLTVQHVGSWVSRTHFWCSFPVAVTSMAVGLQ